MSQLQPKFISAIGTPLKGADERLDHDALASHLADQWKHGIAGVLVAGSMGCMQLLRDETYRELARRSVEFSAGRGEVLVGAGDTSLARTRARIEYLNTLKVDGVVVLTPYFFQFEQAELIDYYTALAEVSKAPLYMYDLPQVTHSKIELATALELSRRPNIRGIKCSDEPSYARQLMDAVAGRNFRVVIAQPILVDVLLKFGITEHLDGMYSIAPHWTAALGRAAVGGDWALAARYQRALSRLRALLIEYGGYQSMSVMLEVRGVGGNYAPAPYRAMSSARREALMAEPVVRALRNGEPPSGDLR